MATKRIKKEAGTKKIFKRGAEKKETKQKTSPTQKNNQKQIATPHVTLAQSDVVVVVDQPEAQKQDVKGKEMQAIETTLQTTTGENASSVEAESSNLEKKETSVDLSQEEEKDSDVSNVTDDTIAIVEESNTLRWILILVILFLVGLLGGLFYFFMMQNKSEEKSSSSSLTTVAVYTPTPTLAQSDKSKYTITVLNGSGVSGQAASGKDFLTKKGYIVSTVGNATDSTYTKTVIKAKESVAKAFIAGLQTDLGEKYTLDSTIASPDSSQTTDVTVIIGSSSQ